MSILYYINAENGTQQPVYSLDDGALETGATKSYYDICMENAGDGQSCDMQRAMGLEGPYVDRNGNFKYKEYLLDTFNIVANKPEIAKLVESGSNLDQWGHAFYKVGQYFVNKFFDQNRKLVFQEILIDQPSKFQAVVKIGLTFVAAYALGPLISQLGASIIGPSLAAEYPALASAVGNTLVQTATSGGDVESAIKNVATSYLGGQVGGFVSGVTDSAVIGKIAGGVSGAIVNGGNLLPAIAGPLISSVAGSVIDSLSLAPDDVSNPVGGDMDNATFGDEFDWSTEPVYAVPDDSWQPTAGDIWAPAPIYEATPTFSDEPMITPVFDWQDTPVFDWQDTPVFDLQDTPVFDWQDTPVFDWQDTSGAFDVPSGGGQIYTFGDISSGYHDPVYDAPVFDTPIFDTGSGGDPSFPDISLPDPSIFLPDFQVGGGGQPSSGGGGTDWASAIAKLGTMALTIWQQQNRPNIKAVTQAARLPDGSVQTVQKNGTVVTTSPTGQRSVTPIPPGQPYRFPDGATIINNGNGTYTRQNANGTVTTEQINTSATGAGLLSGGISAPVMLAGAALLILALRK